MKKREEKIQLQICQWLRIQYPKVIWFCDLSSGMKMSIGQAVKASKMKSSRGLPDLFIAEPRGGYMGMFLELKKEGVKIYLKDGQTIVSDPHLREQAEILQRLRMKNYVADFGIGFWDTKNRIEIYLNT